MEVWLNISAWNALRTGLSASLFSFFNLMLFSLMNVLGVYLIRDIHLQAASLGFLASWDLWGNVIGFIPIGILLDRYPIRRIAITLFSIAILATIALAYTKSLWILCLLRFLQGLASASSLLILMRIGTALVPGHANKVIGLMIFFALAGGIAGNVLFARMAAIIGWQHALLMIAAIGFIFLIIVIFNLYFDEQRVKQTQFNIVFSKHAILSGLHIGILSAPVFVLASLFGNQYLMTQFQLSLSEAAEISSLIFLGIMLGSPVIGWLADFMSNIKLLYLGYLTLILMTGLLSLNLSNQYDILAVMFMGMGIASCTQNLIYPLIYQRHPEARSTAMGVASLVSNGIGALLQISVGLFMQYISQHGMTLFVVMISIYIAGLIACLGLNK